MKLSVIACTALCSCLMVTANADDAIAPSANGTALSNQENKLSFQGLGSIRIGMTVSEFRARNNISGGINIQYDRTIAEADIPTAPCVDVQFYRHGLVTNFAYESLGAQIRKGQIRRVDILFQSMAETKEGIRLGSTEKDVRRAYAGRLQEGAASQESANTSLPGQAAVHAFIVKSEDGKRAYFFETDGVKVVAIHMGFVDDFWINKNDGEMFIEPCYSVLEGPTKAEFLRHP